MPQLQNYVTSSGENTATASVLSTAGFLYGIMVVTDGSNDVTIDLHDNASAASGDKLVPTMVLNAVSNSRVISIPFSVPIAYSKGIYATITTSGTVKYNLYYRQQ